MPIKPDQAISLAINDIEAIEEGYLLRHPRHIATFNPEGLQFTPRQNGPHWAWQLDFVGTSDTPLAGVNVGAVRPVNEQPGVVSYARGSLIEQYVVQEDSLEQQFVIPAPLPLQGNDLVVAGAVRTEAEFEQIDSGWRWRTSTGGISLGDVYVFDAVGRELPASMTVSANETRIVVDGTALSQAAYPVLIDPVIGANDFRVSDMGGDFVYDAFQPGVAYNSYKNEYLVVWRGDDDTGLLVNEEHEIWGQRVDAATGVEIGGDFRISDMGPDGNDRYDAHEPAVVYNSTSKQYLVVWRGEDTPSTPLEFEIYGQLIDSDGLETGANDFRISDMGPDGTNAFRAFDPAVAFNSSNNQYLVVWEGDDTTDGEFEIFGQRLTASGAETGINDFRISDMGPDTATMYGALDPAVAYNSADNQYLVAWEGDDNTGLLVSGEFEIWGQLINAATGAEIGSDFRLSDMGSDGNTSYGAFDPAVTYNSTGNQYLVVWEGDDDTPPLVDSEFEIFGQRVNAATGAEIGGDFRISDMGPDGSPSYDAETPFVAFNNTNQQFLVVWKSDDNTGLLVDTEFEIFGQRLASNGGELGTDIRLSDMGKDGNPTYDAFNPAAAFNSNDQQYLVVWEGDNDTDEEFEIWGQLINAATGTEIGGDMRISNMGSDGNINFGAQYPAVAYNITDKRFLVVWQGDNITDDEFEIYGQFVNPNGSMTGSDFRISAMGTDGDIAFGAFNPAVAYNSTANQFLVVWQGDHTTNDEFEIFGQRLSSTSIVTDTTYFSRISDMGPDGNTLFGAFSPAVTYNSFDNQYLVVWEGDDNTDPLVDNEFEIFGQRLDADIASIGTNDFRISDMGSSDGNINFGAFDPAVAYNSTNNQYLVVWEGDDNTGALIDGEFEIFGQRVDATGDQLGTDFRLSDMGPDGNTNYGAFNPAVTYNQIANEFLVVWHGDDNTGALVDDEFEIFGQRIDAGGVELEGDFRLSDMGASDGDINFGAFNPAATYSSTNNQYLVVWDGDDETPTLVEGEFEIFGQRYAPQFVNMVKNVTPTSRLEPGGVFTFTLTITNTSEGTITVTNLTDENPLPTACTSLISQSIPTGEARSCTYTVTHTEAGSYDNTAWVSVLDSQAIPDSDSASRTVTVTDVLPTVDLAKYVTPLSRLEPGGTFTYTLTITNTSIEQVEVTALSDEYTLSAECDALVGQFIPAGNDITCTYTTTLTDVGTYNNTAEVSVKDNEGNSAIDTASVEVTVKKKWQIYLPLMIR